MLWWTTKSSTNFIIAYEIFTRPHEDNYNTNKKYKYCVLYLGNIASALAFRQGLSIYNKLI